MAPHLFQQVTETTLTRSLEFLWTISLEVYDHNGNTVRHGRARLNQTRMHYYTAGSDLPLLLIYGIPKTNYYWYKLVSLLVPQFTIIAGK